MKDGFIKCGAATPEIAVGDCFANARNVAEKIKSAEKAGVKLLALPELCVSGYTCADMFLHDALLDDVEKAVEYILKETKDVDAVAVIGAPVRKSQKLFNCALVIYKGDILGIVPKTNIPNYGEFYEARYFASGEGEDGEVNFVGEMRPFGKLVFCNTFLADYSFGAEICEDLWVAKSPSVELAANGAKIIVNISAGDETAGKSEYRRVLITAQSGKLDCGYVYASAGYGESTTDAVFAGHNVIAEGGNILVENELFSDKDAIADIDVKRLAFERRRKNTSAYSDEVRKVYFDQKLKVTELDRVFSPMPFVPADEERRKERCELILTMQASGLRKRIAHTKAKKLVVGLSGGLDSALALLVMVKAADMIGMDRSDVIAVTMPCFGTTKRTKSNAEILAKGLGAEFRTVDISKSVESHFADIGQSKDDLDVTFENAQARERTQVLMDIANKCGGLVVGTGDLSESALGWATYNGDHMSMYGVNSSIPKTLVRYLVKYYADASEESDVKKALYDILDTPVSPELLPAKGEDIAQCTEKIVGPYELHDFFLYYTVRWGYSYDKVCRIAKAAFEGKYGDEEIEKWLNNFYNRFFSQQFKRSCMPDGPKVGSVALSPRGDLRLPSDYVSSTNVKK